MTRQNIRYYIFNFLQNKTWNTDKPGLRQRNLTVLSLHAACGVAHEQNDPKPSTRPDLTMECTIPMFTHLPLQHLKLSATGYSLKHMCCHHERKNQNLLFLKRSCRVMLQTPEQHWSTTQHELNYLFCSYCSFKDEHLKSEAKVLEICGMGELGI